MKELPGFMILLKNKSNTAYMQKEHMNKMNVKILKTQKYYRLKYTKNKLYL